MGSVTTPLVVPFARGDASMVDLLGGKGANLAEMTRLGLPVPPGFTITTEACRQFLETGAVAESLFAQFGLDYVSCSPPRVPVARLEAGRAAVRPNGPDDPGTR